MHWVDKGYLLSKKKYSENSIIAEIFTQNHGKVSGIIFGASSKKNKNYLQIGNKLHINYNSKNDSKIGSFKFEIDEILSPQFFDNQKKLSCIISAINLVKILTVESQENFEIYNLMNSLFKMLNDSMWLKNYIFWELKLFKLIGYDLSLKNISSEEKINGKTIYFIKTKNIKKIIPSYLIDLDTEPINTNDLLAGLKLSGDYLDKSILKPNNMNYPKSRLEFINLFK
tara:strand:- start:469 stop:1149 length:681 start_codon:yes stop_codon:yes gene_type:complete